MGSILVIDDDPTIRMMFARALQSKGEVDTASGGAEGLQKLAAARYGAIVVDLHMPVTDGFDVLAALADKQSLNHDTPVFVVTADGSNQARVKATRQHAVFLLTKPVPVGTLVSLVDAALKRPKKA